MKKLLFGTLIAGMACTFYACGGNGQSGNSSTSGDTSTANNNPNTTASSGGATSSMDSSRSSTQSTQPVQKDASDFAMKAADGGLMEVELGKIAQEKASNPRVKNFGAMMVQDHSAANDQLKSIASGKGINIPAAVTDDKRKMIDKLNQKQGKDFDKAYMDMMVSDHKDDISEFRKAADKCSDSSLKNFASTTLPVLQKHLDSAQAIDKTVKR